MYLDLDYLLEPFRDLESLDDPFSIEEIDLVVRDLKADKSPGP
jgi:hypothetical protein